VAGGFSGGLGRARPWYCAASLVGRLLPTRPNAYNTKNLPSGVRPRGQYFPLRWDLPLAAGVGSTSEFDGRHFRGLAGVCTWTANLATDVAVHCQVFPLDNT